MYVCICNSVTECEIVEAAELGARSPGDLATQLGACWVAGDAGRAPRRC
jgi:bacterioferritin-associated ferredoxin